MMAGEVPHEISRYPRHDERLRGRPMTQSDPPVVSIVLPTHNGARFLRESIDSCLAQLYRGFELILVDDASTDATPDILAEYALRDSRVVTIRNEKNLRLPQSLNEGFSHARGRYFTWTSDDNRYRPHALQTMVYMLDHRPEIDLVYSDYSVIDNTGAAIAYHFALPIERLVRVNCVGASFLYRRLVHDAERFDASKPLVEITTSGFARRVRFKLSRCRSIRPEHWQSRARCTKHASTSAC